MCIACYGCEAARDSSDLSMPLAFASDDLLALAFLPHSRYQDGADRDSGTAGVFVVTLRAPRAALLLDRYADARRPIRTKANMTPHHEPSTRSAAT